MVDGLVYCNKIFTKTLYEVAADGLFMEDGRLSAVGLIENMAQTTAARMGYLALYGPEATGVVRRGVIGSIRDLVIHTLPKNGQTISTTVELQEEMGDIILVKAEARCKEYPCARCKMIVSLI